MGDNTNNFGRFAFVGSVGMFDDLEIGYGTSFCLKCIDCLENKVRLLNATTDWKQDVKPNLA